MSMSELTLAAFCESTASKSPTPGGGSVAALTGALGCALAEMTASLTVGKKKFESAEQEMQQLLTDGATLRRELLSLIDADCAAFGGYMAALALPKDTPEEKALRRSRLAEAARASAEAPLAMARAAAKVLPLCRTAVKKGNPGVVTDALMAAMLSRTAIRSAVLNVRINLPSLPQELAAAMETECAALEVLALDTETELLAYSPV